MFGTDRTNAAKSGTVTLIGSGVRVTGNIAFSGYLRVQGEVVGNITCDDDSAGTTVVHGTGSVVGTITSPHVVVGGHVRGSLNAPASIEVHDGAHVVGDASYKTLAIEVGGIIEGSLKPSAVSDGNRPAVERRVAASDSPEIEALDLPLAHERRASDRARKKRPIAAIAAAAIVAAGAAVWLRQGPTVAPPAVDAVALRDEPAPKAPIGGETKAAVAAATVTHPPQPEAPKAEQAKTENPKADAGRIVSVEGVDAEKPAGVVFVNTRGPAVLFLKARDGGGDGTRMDLPARAKKRLPMTRNEVLRIAQGRDIDIYYQGRKLSPSMVEGGQWIAFVPVEAGAGSRE